MSKYKIADVVFDFTARDKRTERYLIEYAYSGSATPCFFYTATDEDLLNEQREEDGFPVWYLESLALFRKLCEYVLDNADGIIFHSSAIAIDGKAYLFTAPSGTGKSTHTRLLREFLGERAYMINDDKPIVRYIDGEFYVYGTPWNGKHRLSRNCKVEIAGICKIYQAKENVIKKASTSEMLVTILNQTLRFSDKDRTEKLLGIIDKMLSKVKTYTLGCNMSEQAAITSYNGMVKGEADET